MNYVERLFHKGVQQGRREGRQEARQEGELRGRLLGQVAAIEGLVRAGFPWSAIESATGVGQDGLRALQQQLAAWDDATSTTNEVH